MNSQAVINTDTALAAGSWNEALADYQQKRALSDALPQGAEGEDEALDAYCDAMDHLIERTAAPNPQAVALKLHMALERSEAFEGLFPDHSKAILSDLHSMADPLVSFARVWLKRWTAKGGSAIMDHQDDTKIWIGQPVYDLSPVGAADEALVDTVREQVIPGMSTEVKEDYIVDRRRENEGRYEGALRELYELLTDMPGGVEAVKRVVREDAKLGLPTTVEG